MSESENAFTQKGVPPAHDPGFSRSSFAPFIGREEERHALDDLVALVTNGMSGSLVFLGDPGVGKSRLLDQVDAAEKIRVVRLVGMESEFRLGFAALHRLLQPHFDRIEALPAPQRDALLTTFGVLSGTPPPRFLIGLGALSLLADASKEHHHIYVIDDVQWLDRESLGILAFVARRVYADGIGFVFAGRENEADLEALAGLPTHHLGGLERSDAYALLDTSGPHTISSLVAARIVAETGGNPLAMLELVGQMTADQLEGRLPLPQRLPIGRGLNAHFLRQVEILPVETQSLLLLASAMSNDDASSLWRAAAVLGLSGESLDPARRAGLITIDGHVAFRHPLIRSAIYRSAAPDQRRASHVALASIAEDDNDLDLAAWHQAAAATAPEEDIAAGLVRSADRAERRGGHVAQALFLGRAAELSPGALDRSLRLFGAAKAYLAAGDGVLAEALLDKAFPWLDTQGMHVELQRLRASIAVFFSRHKDAPAMLLEAVRSVDPKDVQQIRAMLFDALQASLVARTYTVGVTPEDIAQTALATPQPGVPTARDLLLDGFATRLAIGYETAVPLLRAGVGQLFADEAATPALPTTILGWFAADDVWDDTGRRAMFERAAAIERRHGTLGALRITLAGLCVSQALAGEMDKAEESYFEAAEISALIGVPVQATTGVLLEVRAWQGSEEVSRETAELTSRWGREQGAEILEIFSWFGLTILEVGLGNYAAAASYASEIFQRDPPGFGNRILPEIVESSIRVGDTDSARAALDRLSQRALASGTGWALGTLARSRALLARDSDAEAYYLEAIEHLRATSVRTELARAHLLFGEWLRRQKRRRDAQTHLAAAQELFTAMGATGFAARTRAELHATGYRSTPESRQVNLGLTPQETQVARLVATGATNAEVATRMFLTTSTVEYHLSKIFRKLGISSRRQLARVLP